MFAATYLPRFYLEMQPGQNEAGCLRELSRLSKRVEDLTSQLPNVETVRGMFSGEGSKTGSQYRALMHVMDLALADQHETIVDAVSALTAWYWLIKKSPFTPDDYGMLLRIRNLLWSRLHPFHLMGCPMATPKMHCCSKMEQTMTTFGTVEHVSTDSYERAHKAHKAVSARYVVFWGIRLLQINCLFACSVREGG